MLSTVLTYLLIPHELLHIVGYWLVGKKCIYNWGNPYVKPIGPMTRKERLVGLLFPFRILHKTVKTYLNIQITIIFLIVLNTMVLTACGNLSITSPNERILSDTPLKSPPTLTNTPFPTPKPTLTNLPLTSTKVPTKNVKGMQIILDESKLGPQVKAVVYLTNNNTADSFTNISQIWQANVEDIHQTTPIISLTHRRDAFPDGLTISPDDQYLVFGQEYNRRAHTMQVWLLDINQGNLQAIDQDVSPHLNAPPFLWSADSKSVIYTKLLEDWPASELYQYTIDTKQTNLLLKSEGFISLVAWEGSLIYYLSRYIIKPPILRSYNLDTGEIQNSLAILGGERMHYSATSPDAQLALFDDVVVDLKNKTQIASSPFYRPLWLPDSRGIIGGSSKSADISINVNFFKKEPWLTDKT